MPTIRLAIMTAAAVAALADAAAGNVWHPPTTVARGGDVQFDLAMGSDGTAALAWSRDGVRVAVKRPGRAWSRPRRVDEGRFGVGRPAAAVTARGEVVVAWPQNGTRVDAPGPVVGPLTVGAAVRSTRGTWGQAMRIGRTGHFAAAQLDLAANGRGDTVAVWRGGRTLRSGRRTEAIHAGFRPAGGSFTPAQVIPDAAVAALRATPVAGLDERGRAFAAWTSGPEPVVRLATRAPGRRGTWRSSRTLGSSPGSNPVLAVTPGGAAIVAWRASDLDSEGNGIQAGALWTATRSPSGILAAPQLISPARTRNYRIAVNPAGETILSWAPSVGDPASPPDGSALRVAVRPPAGRAFGPATLVPWIRPGEFHGGLATLGDSTTLLAWGADGRVRLVARRPAGGFASAPEVDEPGLYPLVAAAGRRAVAAWVVARGDEVELVAAAGTAPSSR